MSGHQYPHITASGYASIQAGDRYEFNFMTGCEHGHHSTIPSEQIDCIARQLGELQEYLRQLRSQQAPWNTQASLTEGNEIHHHHDRGSVSCSSCEVKQKSLTGTNLPLQTLSTQTSNIPNQRDLLNTPVAETSTTNQTPHPLPPRSIPTSISGEDPPAFHLWTIQIDFECFVRQPNKSQRTKEYRVKAYKPASPNQEHTQTIKGLFSRRSPFQDQDSCWSIFAISTGNIPVDILLLEPYGLARKVEGVGDVDCDIDIREPVKVTGCMRWVKSSTVPRRVRVEIDSQSQGQPQSGGSFRGSVKLMVAYIGYSSRKGADAGE